MKAEPKVSVANIYVHKINNNLIQRVHVSRYMIAARGGTTDQKCQDEEQKVSEAKGLLEKHVKEISMLRYINGRKLHNANTIQLHDVLLKQANIVAIQELCGAKALSSTKKLSEAFSDDTTFKVCL